MKMALLFLCGLMFSSSCSFQKSKVPPPLPPTIVHEAHLQGWYSRDPVKLSADIDEYLRLAREHFPVETAQLPVRALIVPHAGHYYSGLCAAAGYQTLLQKRDVPIKRVIVLAPSHFQHIQGIALPDYTHYKTPLGTIPVDQDAIKTLGHVNLFLTNAAAHGREHAIEIQLPFLQRCLGNFSLVPLLVGHLSSGHYPDLLQQLKKIVDNETLIIVSSDFTHQGDTYDYKPYQRAILHNIRQLDSRIIQSIMTKKIDQFSQLLSDTGATVCGQDALKLMMSFFYHPDYASYHPLLACYYTSAHIEQARIPGPGIEMRTLLDDPADACAMRSVSYSSLVFLPSKPPVCDCSHSLTAYEKKSLIQTAKRTLMQSFQAKPVEQTALYPVLSPALLERCGAFVTLKRKNGDLRGCVGRIVSDEPLYKTVSAMTQAAAFQDTRFMPLSRDELSSVELSITVLTSPRPINNLGQFIVGKHGIILKKNDTSAVFLPQVAVEQGWNKRQTLEQLAYKAGLGRNDWKRDCTFEIFEGFEIKE